MAGNEQLQIGEAVYAPAPTAHGTITETKLGDNGVPLYLVVPDWVTPAHHVGDELDPEGAWYSAEELQRSATRRPPPYSAPDPLEAGAPDGTECAYSGPGAGWGARVPGEV
jgi:hypothetical protein